MRSWREIRPEVVSDEAQVAAQRARLDAECRLWRALVTRDGDEWLAEVEGINGGTHARTLQDLDRYVREVIVLGADLPDDAADGLNIDWRYQ